ncbi:LA_2272 family surface repeat-containing protein [Fulvitalea axinellae]
MADHRNVKTNGLRLEIPGIGFLSFMGNGFPNATSPFELNNYSYSEVMNGLNISTGSWCDCNYNGLTIGIVGQYGKLGNGFSLAGGWNIIDKQNGLQLATIANSSYYMNGVQISAFNFAHDGIGVQIGILNNSKKFKGLQLGLWNVNQKRKLPLINWNFE